MSENAPPPDLRPAYQRDLAAALAEVDALAKLLAEVVAGATGVGGKPALERISQRALRHSSVKAALTKRLGKVAPLIYGG